MIDLRSEEQKKNWVLQSGSNVLELEQTNDDLWVTRLGTKGTKKELFRPMPLVSATVAGAKVIPSDLAIVEVRDDKKSNDRWSLTAKLKHKKQPVEFTVRYSGYAESGAFTSEVSVKNTGSEKIAIDRCASLSLQLPNQPSTLNYLEAVQNQGPQQIERNFRTRAIDQASFQLDNDHAGRSTVAKSLWWSFYRPQSNLSYTAQMAYSGNWKSTFVPNEKTERCHIDLEMTFDNDEALILGPGKSFNLPLGLLIITPGKEISDHVIALHRFQENYAIPKQKENDPLLVQFNTWYALSGEGVNEENMKKLIPLAKRIGAEAYVIDAGWYYSPTDRNQRWHRSLGDWEIDPRKFPQGLGPTIKLVHEHGMKFGLWFEPECASPKSKPFREHPDWFLTYKGEPIFTLGRYHLDYSKPEVRKWMMAHVERIMGQGQIDWLKLDYNNSVGWKFDSTDDGIQHTRLYNHVQGYYQWLDELAKRHPKVVIENCSSGGYRTDLGMLSHTHTGWISDTINPRYSLQLAWGALVEMPPSAANHWMIGDVGTGLKNQGKGRITSTDPRWWDTMFRIPMNGQFGISSRLDLWPEATLVRAKENVDLYKRIRTVINHADVYHLTPMPDLGFNPSGWMGIQYVQPKQGKSVLMAYRLGESNAENRFRLRGLVADKKYQISRDGVKSGEKLGSELMKNGLSVKLENEFYSEVVELSAAD
jgi:alpha-galactosidase